MKNLKLTTFTVFAVIALTFYGQSAFALMRVPIPDSSDMQPMPSPNIKPNISGNINYQSDKIQPTPDNSNKQNENLPVASNVSGQKSNEGFSSLIILILSVGLLAIAPVFIKKKANTGAKENVNKNLPKFK